MNMEQEFYTWCQSQEYALGTVYNFLRYMRDATLKDGRKIFSIPGQELIEFFKRINLYEFLINEKPDTVDYKIIDGVFDYSGLYAIDVQRGILKQGLHAYLEFLKSKNNME